jgi:hypothetical protein
MSKLKDSKSNVLGSIAAMQTLLERYPVLTTTDSMLTNFSVNTSVGFLLDVLTIFGVSQDDLIKWISKLLTGSGDGQDGLLVVIEQAVKAILMANIKDMWTCYVDPIIPDSVLRYSNPVFPAKSASISQTEVRKDPYTIVPQNDKNNKKIEIDLNQIDLFGIFNHCPSDKNGGLFYFDAYESICYPDDGNIPYLSPNNLWKSCDFNAYLWYIINKGTLSNLTDLQQSCWDNRNKYVKEFKGNRNLRNEFFDIGNCTGYTVAPEKTIEITDTDSKESVYKKQIILCEFEERPTPSTNESGTLGYPSSNILRVWLNANRYYHTEKIEVPDIHNPGQITTMEFNKTIFEFNYDYIYSLKLFDSKTLIAQILDAMLGLSASISLSFSMQQKMIEAKIGEIVKKVIEADDTSSSDCYYEFSNDEYDRLVTEATNNYSGVYSTNVAEGSYGAVDAEAILDSLRNIKQSDNLVEQQASITKTLEEIMATAASPASITDECKFSFGLNFIKDFIMQTVTQIVLQVLSPKVAILYQINGAIMGTNVDNMKSWENFLKNFQNVLFNIIKQVKDIIVEELYKFVMDQLKPLLELMIAKIALETVMYYKELIEQLLFGCFAFPGFGGSNGNNMVIDNVNYADITTEAEPTDYDNDTKC